MSSAIAFDIPEDIRAARDGLLAFAHKEVIPRFERHKDQFEDQRRLYHESGRLSDPALAIIREVRIASSKAGF
jgi:hypothetical protein